MMDVLAHQTSRRGPLTKGETVSKQPTAGEEIPRPDDIALPRRGVRLSATLLRPPKVSPWCHACQNGYLLPVRRPDKQILWICSNPDCAREVS